VKYCKEYAHIVGLLPWVVVQRSSQDAQPIPKSLPQNARQMTSDPAMRQKTNPNKKVFSAFVQRAPRPTAHVKMYPCLYYTKNISIIELTKYELHAINSGGLRKIIQRKNHEVR
jgi:hypothetical protein